MKRTVSHCAMALVCAFSPVGQVYAEPQESLRGKVGRTLAESVEAWPAPVRAPADAPNVIWILLDDVGFGAASTFGGGVSTPQLDALAQQGLRYTNFHTAAVCAPTRAALLTGRNSSSVHVAGFANRMLGAGFPGWDGRIPATAGTIAETLRDNGYNTLAVGKYGVTPDDEMTDAGPFDRWPTGKGFEQFFGFLGSETDQYKPDLVEGQAHVTTDGRHLGEQITDKAIAYIDRQKKAAAHKPFFLYYAPAATHAPHQVAAAWSDRYKNRFDEGWDVYRRDVFARQKKLGLIPSNAVLPDRDPRVKPWSALGPREKKLYARFMEVFAGYLTFTDNEIGRLVDYLKQTNQFDNTLFVVVIGDNGASKEGTPNGNVDRAVLAPRLSEEDNVIYNLTRIGKIGTPDGPSTNYPLGWAQATNTPFRCWKGDANCEGGTHNPLIISYPKRIKARGIRTQYGHVIDLLPTTLELAGATARESIRGIPQQPVEGTSLAYSIDDPDAASRHLTQYYYVFGGRAIYRGGWKASLAAVDPLFGDGKAGKSSATPAWKLYNLNADPTERVDLSAKYPEKVAELEALFEREAQTHNLYPLITMTDVMNRMPQGKGR